MKITYIVKQLNYNIYLEAILRLFYRVLCHRNLVTKLTIQAFCRCKIPVLQSKGPRQCPVCSSPIHLNGQPIVELSQRNVACTQPRILGQETTSTTELFLEDPSLIQAENGEFVIKIAIIK